jgi:peroxiredoxin Q/BCP
MLRVNDLAPDFRATGHDGKPVQLGELRGRWVVMFFFPKAFTPGCTAETKAFHRDEVGLEKAGAVVLGISTDPLEKQCAFAESIGVGFRLIADEDRAVSRAYGALWPLVGIARRITYVIDPQGKIAFVYRGELRAAGHAEQVRSFLEGAVARGARNERPPTPNAR